MSPGRQALTGEQMRCTWAVHVVALSELCWCRMESRYAEPDVLLEDLIFALHPDYEDVMRGGSHQPVWLREVHPPPSAKMTDASQCTRQLNEPSEPKADDCSVIDPSTQFGMTFTVPTFTCTTSDCLTYPEPDSTTTTTTPAATTLDSSGNAQVPVFVVMMISLALTSLWM